MITCNISFKQSNLKQAVLFENVNFKIGYGKVLEARPVRNVYQASCCACPKFPVAYYFKLFIDLWHLYGLYLTYV